MYLRRWRQPRGGKGDSRPISANVQQVLQNLHDRHPQHFPIINSNPPNDSSWDSDDSTTTTTSSWDSDDSTTTTTTSNDDQDNFNLRDLMDPDAIYGAIKNLPTNDPSRKSYEALLEHECWPKHVDPRFQPFDNIACFMCWLGIGDDSLKMSRNLLTWVLNLLLTLQDHGYISQSLWIPTDATTITQYDRYFPDPPVC